MLSDQKREYDELSLELDYDFEDFRSAHLEPLTELTLSLQEWLQTFGRSYFVAQRLKRKPQILRKLRRFSVRLTQLQDIGGCRIIVENNSDVDDLISFVRQNLRTSKDLKVNRETDYRQFGRDDTGYRAFHFVISTKSGVKLELQLRSRIQHYWSESIERTSVVYGHRLKEQEGDGEVIEYFKAFSNVLHRIENSLSISSDDEIDLERRRQLAESIISQSTSDGVGLSSHVNEGVVKTLSETEKSSSTSLNNWVLVFDWKDGNFVTWEIVGRDPKYAVETYSRYEREYPEEDKYEVVLIGSSDISTVRQTHSHYFGIEHHNSALEQMETSIIGLSKRNNMDVGARRILSVLKRRRYWGKNTIKIDTLKNHFCNNIASFNVSLEDLKKRGFVIGTDPVSLDIKMNKQIAEYV
ncbi:MAG: RelA/SpoT domain-containing protein [Pseudomonadota bacterium]